MSSTAANSSDLHVCSENAYVDLQRSFYGDAYTSFCLKIHVHIVKSIDIKNTSDIVLKREVLKHVYLFEI